MIVDMSSAIPRPPINNYEAALRLCALRALRDLTQSQLAEKAGVSLSTVTRAESGTFSANSLVKLNAVLESSLDYILWGDTK